MFSLIHMKLSYVISFYVIIRLRLDSKGCIILIWYAAAAWIEGPVGPLGEAQRGVVGLDGQNRNDDNSLSWVCLCQFMFRYVDFCYL